MLSVRDLSFSYNNKKKILDGISFSLSDGESLCILGRNGSGKSTLLRLIATLVEPKEGIIELDGISSGNKKDMRSRIGFIFQNTDSCFVEPTVSSDIEFSLDMAKRPKGILSYLLSSFHLERIRDSEILTLSAGEKERALFSSISALDRSLYLFDESLSNLDPVSRFEMLSFIKDLKKKEKSVIMVTHRAEDALSFDRTMLLKDGRILALAPSREVLNSPVLLSAAGVRMPEILALQGELSKRGVMLERNHLELEELCSELGI